MKLTQEKADLLVAMQYRSLTKHCYINGEKHEFKIDVRFSPQKTRQLLDELIKFIEVSHTEEVEGFRFTDMIFTLILKYFTDVPLFIRKDVTKMDNKEVIEIIDNCSRVTNALASIICDDGRAVLQFLSDNIEEEEISKLEKQVAHMIVALNKFSEYKEETQRLVMELSNYIENTMKKAQLAKEIDKKIKDLENGAERVFEKEMD